MGSYWLNSCLPELAAAFGNSLYLYPGYETRSRSSGGFDAIRGIVIHHDASGVGSSNAAVLRYEYETATDRPIGNFHVMRNGSITWGVAGASNTAGRGGPVNTSRGTVPQDKANQYMISIEASNNGIGEIWNDQQLDQYIKLVVVLCKKYGLNPLTDIYGHYDWCMPSCPGRKIDPAGPTPKYPKFGGTSGRSTWNIAEVRKEVNARIVTASPSPPPNTNSTYVVKSGDGWWAVCRGLGLTPSAETIKLVQTANAKLPPNDFLTTGMLIKAPGTVPTTDWQAVGGTFATPPASMNWGNVYQNTTWYQAVLCAMNKLPVDGGGPIYPPNMVGADRLNNGPEVANMYGDRTRDATAYWQSKNGLTADGWFGTLTANKMLQVRGK